MLEARLNLSDFYITNLFGPTDSLDSALAANDASGGGNTIIFDNNVFATHQTIQMPGIAGGDFQVNSPVTIIGPDAGLTLVGNDLAPMFEIFASTSISNLTIEHAGHTAIYSWNADQDLTLTNCNFTDNNVDLIDDETGGAITNYGGNLTVSAGPAHTNILMR